MLQIVVFVGLPNWNLKLLRFWDYIDYRVSNCSVYMLN